MKWILLILLSLFSCNESEKDKTLKNPIYNKDTNEHKTSQWRILKNGLWQDNHGNIGFKTSKALSEIIFVDRYITTTGNEEKKLKDVIDIVTFESVRNTSSYYKDKNNVYVHFSMIDGGWFGIVKGADSATFKSIGGVYSKDKSSIFVEKFGKMNVEYETFEVFETKNTMCCYGKDKNSYYEWNDKIDMNDSDFLEIKKLLDKMN